MVIQKGRSFSTSCTAAEIRTELFSTPVSSGRWPRAKCPGFRSAPRLWQQSPRHGCPGNIPVSEVLSSISFSWARWSVSSISSNKSSRSPACLHFLTKSIRTVKTQKHSHTEVICKVGFAPSLQKLKLWPKPLPPVTNTFANLWLLQPPTQPFSAGTKK